MNQIKDLPPSLFQNLQNLKQLWETHSALYYLCRKLCCLEILVPSLKVKPYFYWDPSVVQYFSVIHFLFVLICPVIHWLAESLFRRSDRPYESQTQSVDFTNNYFTICVPLCVCFRNISNNPLAHIYDNQFDSLVNLQSLWVSKTLVKLLYWCWALGEIYSWVQDVHRNLHHIYMSFMSSCLGLWSNSDC